jgi:hypothetical protein
MLVDGHDTQITNKLPQALIAGNDQGHSCSPSR